MKRNYANFRKLFDTATGKSDRKARIPNAYGYGPHHVTLRKGPGAISVVYKGEVCVTYHSNDRITVKAAKTGLPANLNKFLPSELSIVGNLDRRIPPALFLGQTYLGWDTETNTPRLDHTVPIIRCDEPVVIKGREVIKTSQPFHIRSLDRRKARALRDEYGLTAFTAWLDAIVGLDCNYERNYSIRPVEELFALLKAGAFDEVVPYLRKATMGRSWRSSPKKPYATALSKLTTELYARHDAYSFTPKKIINIEEFRALKPQ